MKTITIAYEGNDLSKKECENLVASVNNMLPRNKDHSRKIQILTMDDADIMKILSTESVRVIDGRNKNQNREHTETIQVPKDLGEALEFITRFGDARDGENQFRARFNKLFWLQPQTSQEAAIKREMFKYVKVFSHYKVRNQVTQGLFEAMNLTWLPVYCESLLIYMDQSE